MNIKELQERVHATAVSKGWYEGVPNAKDPTWIAARLALVHSEVSEALECARDGELERCYKTDQFGNAKPEGLAPELADVVIRVLDLAASLGIDLEEEIDIKARFNETRKHRHGGRKL